MRVAVLCVVHGHFVSCDVWSWLGNVALSTHGVLPGAFCAEVTPFMRACVEPRVHSHEQCRPPPEADLPPAAAPMSSANLAGC